MTIYTRLQASSRNPWLGDRLGGFARRTFVVSLIFILGSLASMLFGEIDTRAIAATWIGNQPALRLLPASLLEALVFIFNSKRFYFLITVACLVAFLVGVHYLRAVYDMKSFRQALRYFNAIVFALNYPRLTIENGKARIPKGKTNLIMEIGGPGFLVIQPGNLVLLESTIGEPRVCAEGLNFVTRIEKIREIISLDDQKDFIEEIVATTKDGLRIRVRDVNYSYRLRTGRTHSERARQSKTDPYPFSYQAVLDMFYSRSVGKGGVTPWRQMVRLAVDGAITGYIRQNRFDNITSPGYGQAETRVEIARQINAEGTRFRLKGVGAELLWVDMGHFEIVDERVEEQLVDTWGAKWSGEAEAERAYGEATEISNLEKGRAEAEAEMLLKIFEVFDTIENLDDPDLNIRSIMLNRTAQILEGMAAQGLLPPGSDDEITPPLPKNRR